MIKKLLCVALCSAMLLMSGCSKSRHIDTAAIAQSVAVDTDANGRLVYSYFLLSSDNEPWVINITANSFKDACELAEQKYIPNLSLSKINLMLINEKIFTQTLKSDVEYVSGCAEFSPLAYVSLADTKAIERMKSEKRVQDIIENELQLLKTEDVNVNTNFISVYNSIQNDSNGFNVSLINSDKELKTDILKIKL